jgi:hypothetical protein
VSVAVAKMVRISDGPVIEALLAKLEPRLRARFREAIAWLRTRYTVKELEQLIADGRAAQVLADDAAKAGAKFAAEVQAVYIAAARELAEVLSERTGIPVALDATNPRALRQLERMRLQIVGELRREQRDLVVDLVTDAVARGKHPVTAARTVRDALGLTKSQRQHVRNYRRYLETLDGRALERQLRDRRFDKTVARAIKSGTALTPKQISRMVARYEQRYIRRRATVVAHAHALGAVHGGAFEGWQQAADSGAVRRSEIRRGWRTGPATKHRREFHQSIVGQVVGLDESFISGRGNALRFPHDPEAPLSETLSCRCQVITRLVPDEKPAAQLAA